jgi:hypothetical protein
MNYVEVKGGTKKQRELAEEIAYFCVHRLMPRIRTLNVELNLKKIPDAQGYCMCLDAREFEVEIEKSLKGDDFITCITHEFVHVWQYAVGTLKQTNAGKNFWKGKDYSDTCYSKQPWERQAYRMQETLMEEYKLWKKEQV